METARLDASPFFLGKTGFQILATFPGWP